MTRLHIRLDPGPGKSLGHPYRNEAEPYAIEKRTLRFAITVPNFVAYVLIKAAWLFCICYAKVARLFGKQASVEVDDTVWPPAERERLRKLAHDEMATRGTSWP